MVMKFRRLKENEIDCRVGGSISKNGFFLLLYKDARVDMNVLDETVGAMNWQKSYSRDNANCTVSIWDEDKRIWISKEDTGTESNTEKEKGLASDSFKRACFNWGIGRELYTAPKIWVSGSDCTIKEGNNGKLACYDEFRVKHISYDDEGNIKDLKIVNDSNGKVVYPKGKNETKTENETKVFLVGKEHISTLRAEMERTGIAEQRVLLTYGLKQIEDMTISQFNDAMKKFPKDK